MNTLWKRLSVAGLVLWAAACAPVETPTPLIEAPGLPAPTVTSAPPDATARPSPPPSDLPPADLPAAVPSAAAPIIGELPPDLRARLEADLSQRTGAARTAFRLVRAEAITWNDGALGCPQPGMFYTQMLEDGYWVVWQVNGQTYDYRATTRGTFLLCPAQRTGLPLSPQPTPVLQVPDLKPRVTATYAAP